MGSYMGTTWPPDTACCHEPLRTRISLAANSLGILPGVTLWVARSVRVGYPSRQSAMAIGVLLAAIMLTMGYARAE